MRTPKTGLVEVRMIENVSQEAGEKHVTAKTTEKHDSQVSKEMFPAFNELQVDRARLSHESLLHLPLREETDKRTLRYAAKDWAKCPLICKKMQLSL